MSVSFRAIPAVDRVLREPAIAVLLEKLSLELVKSWTLEAIAGLRARLEAGEVLTAEQGLERALEVVLEREAEYRRPYHRPILNATGILAHTGLGRSPLAPEVGETLREISGASVVEVEPASGKRGIRERCVGDLIARLTGAEAATVVNNNAAATLLALKALAEGREAVVSRGELVEIGGAFRMPDVMEQGGVRLREVGTTNRTRLRDYERALNENTGLFVKVHHSNFRQLGFVESVPLAELVALGQSCGVPVMEDLGSGLLLQRRDVLPEEPRIQDSIACGADLVCFSGDKLLGGPQAGILAGKGEAIRRIRAHPLFRALRPCKLTLAALEATLRIYLEGEAAACAKIPLLRGLCRTLEEIEERARAWAERFAERVPGVPVGVEQSVSFAGSGAAPLQELASRAAVLGPLKGLDELARRLRLGEPGIFTRTEGSRLWIDFRTLNPEDDERVLEGVVGSLE